MIKEPLIIGIVIIERVKVEQILFYF